MFLFIFILSGAFCFMVGYTLGSAREVEIKELEVVKSGTNKARPHK